jgi:DnaJ-class molecular chaperone
MKTKMCPGCRGEGWLAPRSDRPGFRRCWTCKGTGKVEVKPETFAEAFAKAPTIQLSDREGLTRYYDTPGRYSGD